MILSVSSQLQRPLGRYRANRSMATMPGRHRSCRRSGEGMSKSMFQNAPSRKPMSGGRMSLWRRPVHPTRSRALSPTTRKKGHWQEQHTTMTLPSYFFLNGWLSKSSESVSPTLRMASCGLLSCRRRPRSTPRYGWLILEKSAGNKPGADAVALQKELA
jgi:hypothetical protein